MQNKKAEYVKIIKWTIERLNIQKPYPTITLSSNQTQAKDGHHTGVNYLDDNQIWIYVGGRNLIDVARTIMHELCHTRQHQLGMVKPGSSYPGSAVEVMADAMAGKMVKEYGKENRQIFESKLDEIVDYGNNHANVPMQNYMPYFENAKIIDQFNGLNFKITKEQTYSEKILYGLFTPSDELVSILTLTDARNDETGAAIQVASSDTNKKYSGKGCMSYLFLRAINAYGSLASDTHHSTDAQMMWRSFISKFKNFKYFKLDMSTGLRYPIRSLDDLNDIWRDNESPIIVAEK